MALALVLALFGWLAYDTEITPLVGLLSTAALVVLGLALVRPSVLGPVRSGLEWITAPIRNLVRAVVLVVVFFALVTPIGLVLRWLGRIGVREKRDSYWVDRDPSRDEPGRAFRQS